MKTITDTLILHNGLEIPVIGFGTWQTPNDEVGYQAVLKALEVGYRHIDTAAIYQNEEAVGRAIKDSGIAREEIFLTSKLWNDAHSYKGTKEAFERSLQLLGTDYLDLYLIHWPNPPKYRSHWQEANSETWRAMEDLYKEGKIKAIGVSNFMVHHIDALIETAKILPMVDQIRLCPGDAKKDLVDYLKDKNIAIEAYSPLGTGKVFGVEILESLAEKYTTSVAKLCIRWSAQNGFIPLPKSVTPERIQSNTEIFDFLLSEDDMAAINGLEGVSGYGTDPDLAGF